MGTVEIPVRMLFAVLCAAKENTRYTMDAVQVSTKPGKTGADTVTAVATDGRRLIVAQWDSGLFDTGVNLLIPGEVARTAVKLAIDPKAGDSPGEPLVQIFQEPDNCRVQVTTENGNAILTWGDVSGAEFPPYQSVIPDWSKSKGVALIGVNPELMATTLKAIQKIIGTEQAVKVFLPSHPKAPLGFEGTDADRLVTAMAIVMPVQISEWTQKITGKEGEAATPERASDPDLIPLDKAMGKR